MQAVYLLVVCVKGLCQCTVQAVYLSLLVVCVKGLCRCTVQAVYLSVGSLCKGFPPSLIVLTVSVDVKQQ